VQVAALGAALLGACSSHGRRSTGQPSGSDHRLVFVLAATLEILLLAGNPHAGEYLKDMLVGQILWSAIINW